MTFLEAAIAILKREGQPLHFKKLTEIALKENLLTVVGRTPEATMQQRLNDALKKDSTQSLTREKPGVFGLRFYPPPEEPATKSAPVEAAPQALPPPMDAPAIAPGLAPVAKDAAPPVAPSPEGEERKRRRRRGGRGRKKRVDGKALDNSSDAGSIDDGEDAAAEDVAATPATAAPREIVAPPSAQATFRLPESEPARPIPPSVEPARRSFADAAAMVAAAHGRHPATPTAPPSEAAAPANQAVSTIAQPPAPAESQERHSVPSPWAEDRAAVAAPSVSEIDESSPSAVADFADDGGEDEEDLEGDIDAPSGPLIAPAHGTEDMVRGDEHRPLYEGNHRRSGRERSGRRGKGAPSQRGAPHAAASASPTVASPSPVESRTVANPPSRDARPAEGKPIEPRVAGATSMSLVDAAAEILRGSDGRPMPIKQLVELAMRRNLLHGDPAELGRSVRAAVLVDLRAREASGLRPRVRPVGGGQYVLGDRKLEGELSQYERELGERAARLSEATRVALHRRLARLSPPAFEALARLIVGRLGVAAVEMVKRGDGVVYLGGERLLGVQKVRVLIAVRPGEGELKRRAVGELRAGLKARTFDEGICIAAGRAGGEAIAELGAGDGRVELYDGDALATLCARFAIGIVKRGVAVDTLDVELFNELQEG